MPFAKNADIRLYWRFDGDGEKPVLFLLNSIGTDMAVWDRALPHLLPDFRVLRMDARGHGASDAPLGDYTLALLASDALVVMDAAGVGNAAVCGLSLGGMIAMQLALTAPQRVNALVLVCTSARMDSGAWQARSDSVRKEGMAAIAGMALQRFFAEDFRHTHPAPVETVKTALMAMAADGYAGCCAAIRDMALINRLDAIQLPTLVIAGTKDVSTPFDGHGSEIAKRIVGAHVVHLAAAHLAPVERPAEFSGALRTFLSEISAGPAVRGAKETLFEAGLKTRRKVLGDAWVDRSLANRTPFNADFQAMITRYAWNEIWGRPGLDHRTRRLLVIAITAALGRWEEFRLHVRAGLEQGGFTEDELKETLMQSAIYAGVPAANTAFSEASDIVQSFSGTAPSGKNPES